MESKKQDLTFEQAMAALDETVARLEKGDCTLEEMIALHEKGTRYAAVCTELLNAYEKRIGQIQIRREERA